MLCKAYITKILSLLLLLLPLLPLLICQQALADSATEMRFMSLTIQDSPISVSDAKAVASGSTTLTELIDTWLASDAHKVRIKRYFNDQYGVGPEFNTISSAFILQQQSDGAYYLEDKGTCSETISIEDAWWLNEGESIKVCTNTLSTRIFFEYEGKDDLACTSAGSTGIGADECGCGPRMALCYPHDLSTTLLDHVRYEFRERGLYVYENDLSWFDLFGGNFFYGSRVLYKHYLDQQAFGRNIEPSLTDLVDLTALPLTTYERRDFPATGSVERAGNVTAPGFLRQYRSIRSRIDILTARLLCKDVDPTLNTEGIATFVNETMAADDIFLSGENASNENCSGCHFPMDNMGSTLWLWGENGWYQYWGTLGEQDETGHVFGQAGSGPAFLIQGYLDADGYDACMAKTAWEDFSGGFWSDLGSISKANFINASKSGPRSLIQSILNSQEIRQLHNRGIPQTIVGGASVYNFEAEINPILKKSCSGGSCHSVSTVIGSQYEFIDNAATFKASPTDRINDGTMPPSTSALTISEGDQAILKAWRDAN